MPNIKVASALDAPVGRWPVGVSDFVHKHCSVLVLDRIHLEKITCGAGRGKSGLR